MASTQLAVADMGLYHDVEEALNEMVGDTKEDSSRSNESEEKTTTPDESSKHTPSTDSSGNQANWKPSGDSGDSSTGNTSEILPGRKTVFIDGLPPDMTELQLRRELEPFGTRLASKFSKDASGKIRCAVVKFKSPQQAANFIAFFHNRELQKKSGPISAQYANQEHRGDDPETDRIFVANLPSDITASQLKAAFDEFGDVMEVDPFQRKDDNTGMGCGTVRFATIEQASAAIDGSNNRVLFKHDGRRLVVKFWEAHANRVQHKQQELQMQQARKAQQGAFAGALPTPPNGRMPPYRQQLPTAPAVGRVPTVQIPQQQMPMLPQAMGMGPAVMQGQQQMPPMQQAYQPPVFSVLPPGQAHNAPMSSAHSAKADNTTPSRQLTQHEASLLLPPGPIVYVDQLKPQVGDVLIYNAPITRNFVIDTLTSRYGQVMYCLDAPQVGGFAVRMYNTAQHDHIALELNGAMLNTGHSLSAGLIQVLA